MTPRDHRALVLGGTVVLVAVIGTRGIPAAWRALTGAKETLQARAALLARAREDVSGASALEDSAAKVKVKVHGLAPRILGGGGPAEAVADLSARVSTMADMNRVRLERTTPIEDSAASGGLRRVSLRLTLMGDSRGTFGLLGSLAKGPVALMAADLRIVAPNPIAPNRIPEILETEMTVRGWYQLRDQAR